MRRLSGVFAPLCLFVCLGAMSTAEAQSPSFQVEQFEPLPLERTNLLNLATSEISPHLSPSVGLVFHYVDEPLRLRDGESGEIESSLVASQLKAEVWAGVGLFDFADIGLIVPTVVYQGGDEFDLFGTTQSIDAVALADARLVPKLKIPLPELFEPFGAAVAAPVYLPSGDDQSFNSDGALRAEPRLALDWNHNDFIVATNVAYQVRPETVAHNHVVDDVVRWGAAVEAPVGVAEVGAMTDNPKVIASMFGNVQLADDVSPSDQSLTIDRSSGSPLELQLAIRAFFPADVGVIVGGGAGLNNHVGSPNWRVFTSIGYVSEGREEDPCRDQPGEFDGEGCSVPDRDEDGIPDDQDNCPDTPNRDQLDSDEDGVGDACDDDRDGDGVPNDEDNCADVPNRDQEDADEDGVGDACEDDRDGDGILDEEDNCPQTPNPDQEDLDGDGIGDACDDDIDGDGVPDEEDNCPETANNGQADSDEDGVGDACDDDIDGDGIPNDEDQCPDEPETFNDIEDEDGCPDSEKVRVTDEEIEINERVYFDTGKATIKNRSFELLNEVASILEEHPNITRLRIEGHTDSRGSASFNEELSQRRAEAVRDYLVAQGISPDLLEAKGMGESDPIDSNDTKEGRAKNRRVEFKIVERSDSQ